MKKSCCWYRTSPALFVLALLVAVSADAATITVTSTADAGGGCPGASCTLRQAIAIAASGDTINFSLPANSAITLTSGELLINKNLTISGPGADLVSVQRSAGNFRIFEIASGSQVTISGLTMANGNAASGGGIYNNGGTLTVSNSTLSGNDSGNGGGGIHNLGTLTLTNSTISGNSASFGGGIYNGGNPATITNCTISGNTATSGGGSVFASATLTITNSTISGNSTAGQGGGIAQSNSAMINVRNTIIAKNTAASGPDFSGTLTSQGYNMIGNTSGMNIAAGSDTTGNQLNVDPVLGPLQNNGGPTFTHALLSSSTAIDGGNSSGSNTDQRGFARAVDSPSFPNASGGDGSDIGAYEVQADQLPGCNTINRIVNNNTDSGPDSLRVVIANVCAGSTITFAPSVTGAINLTSGELLLNKSLTINGPGANLLSVQRSPAAGNFRIFNIAPASVIATISGLTIANGNNIGNGGGIYNNGGTLTVSNSIVSGHSAGGGGGGGGIFSNLGTLTVNNSTISGNSAGFGGGGINSFHGTVTVINSSISGNTTNGGHGGGIYISGDSTTGKLIINNCTISGNSASDNSSGLAIGGGIHNGGATVIVTNSTIAGNLAQFQGGGINSHSTTLRSRNTIIALNTSPSGPDVSGTLTSENCNLIGNNSGVTIAPAQFSDQIGTPGSPLNPLLGPLQDNGGPTLTRALLSGSPALDKGHSSGSTTDQRGFPRTFDNPMIPNATDGDGTDIGAFELFAPFAVSRKMHGAAVFDISLPLSGAVGIECRTSGANGSHQVIVTFPTAVSLTSASVTTGTGSVSSFTVSGGQVTVNLAGVANSQKIVLTLFGVSDGMNTTNIGIPMGVLLGDTSGNGLVNASDVSLTKLKSGQAVDSSNFRNDINVNGSINASDVSTVKLKSGTALP